MDAIYKFDLPDELIAQTPAEPRDHARFLVFDRATKQLTDDFFYNLTNYLPANTTIVANNSKVEHCRYLFEGGSIEVFAVEKMNDKTIRAMVRPGKKFKVGQKTELASGLWAETTAIDENGLRTIVFSVTLDHQQLRSAAHIPLPPYIAQNDNLADEYQTVYAKPLGSLAAPTAGLHFTNHLKAAVQKKHDWQEVTLHVGLGTFAPLKPENFISGTLHTELYEIDSKTAKAIQAAEHITAIGTTSCRTIETLVRSDYKDLSGGTDIFITPGVNFLRVNSLITNFHLPSTSLLLLVEAFLGNRQDLETIYAHAIEQKYRFYSFGDAMLIL